jgi:hypothetical protein
VTLGNNDKLSAGVQRSGQVALTISILVKEAKGFLEFSNLFFGQLVSHGCLKSFEMRSGKVVGVAMRGTVRYHTIRIFRPAGRRYAGPWYKSYDESGPVIAFGHTKPVCLYPY